MQKNNISKYNRTPYSTLDGSIVVSNMQSNFLLSFSIENLAFFSGLTISREKCKENKNPFIFIILATWTIIGKKKSATNKQFYLVALGRVSFAFGWLTQATILSGSIHCRTKLLRRWKGKNENRKSFLEWIVNVKRNKMFVHLKKKNIPSWFNENEEKKTIANKLWSYDV